MLEYGILQYTMEAYLLRAHHEVEYGVVVEKNYGCISEDNPWFLKMEYSQIAMDHQKQRYHDEVISKEKRKKERERERICHE